MFILARKTLATGLLVLGLGLGLSVQAVAGTVQHSSWACANIQEAKWFAEAVRVKDVQGIKGLLKPGSRACFLLAMGDTYQYIQPEPDGQIHLVKLVPVQNFWKKLLSFLPARAKYQQGRYVWVPSDAVADTVQQSGQHSGPQ